MSTPCAIRFTDETGDEAVTICRYRHGHPEHVIGNLAELEELYEAVGRDGSPGEVAAQFLFIDKLWYILFMYERGELGSAIWDLLANPGEMPKQAAAYLMLHTICQSRMDQCDRYLYRVTVKQPGYWTVSIQNRSRDNQECSIEWCAEVRLCDAWNHFISEDM